MKKIILLLALSLFAINSYADDVDVYYTYGTTSQVTSARLNGNITNIITQVNGNLTNDNADTSSGFRFYEVLSASPSVSPEGRLYYNTATDTLNMSNGTAYTVVGYNATTLTITDNENTAENNPLVFVAGGDLDGGDLGLESDGTCYYTPSTGTITTTEFVGGGSGITGLGNKLDGFTIGTNGDYTTIQAALNANNSGGEQFWITEDATYTEAVSFTADNQSIIGLGSPTNTIITMAADRVINFGTWGGCTLANVTVSVTAADASADQVIYSNNNNASDYNYVRNCILSFATSADIAVTGAIYISDGNIDMQDIVYTFSHTHATQTNTVEGMRTEVGAGHTTRLKNFKMTMTVASNGATGSPRAMFCDYQLLDFENVSITLLSPNGVTNQANVGLYIYSNGVAGNRLRNVDIDVQATSTAKATALDISEDTYYTGGKIHCTTGDGDGVWFVDSANALYATGVIVTGDCGATATTSFFNGVSINGDFISGGGNKLANATEAGAMFWDGIVIGTDNDNNILDDATHGSGVGTLYLGNATVDATFTGFHYYKLGDTNLKAGELVTLKDGKLYRSTKKQDPTAIGLYCGLTNWKDSLGNELVDGEEIDEKYYDDKEKKEKTRKKINYGKSVNKKTNKLAKADDYSYSVAVIGDSMHENTNAPLLGAWVTTDAGNIKNGDYLCSSSKAGYLEKQSDDVMHSYTIGKAREDINKDTKAGYIYLLQ